MSQENIKITDQSIALEALRNWTENNKIKNQSLTFVEYCRQIEGWENANLIDLSGLSIEKMDFSKYDFGRVNLQNTEFKDCKFNNSKVRGENFSGAQFNNCELNRAILKAHNFSRSQFTGCELGSLQIDAQNLDVAKFTSCIMENMTIQAKEMKTAQFESCQNAKKLRVTSDNLYGSKFTNINMQESEISAQSMRTTKFEECDLTGTKFKGNLESALFVGGSLREANFLEASNVSLVKFQGNMEFGQHKLPASETLALQQNILKQKETQETQESRAELPWFARFTLDNIGPFVQRVFEAAGESTVDSEEIPIDSFIETAEIYAGGQQLNPKSEYITAQEFKSFAEGKNKSFADFAANLGKKPILFGADLQNINVSGKDLQGARFLNCRFNNVNFLAGCSIKECRFDGSSIEESKILGSSIKDVTFTGTKFNKTSIESSSLEKTRFLKAFGSELTFKDCTPSSKKQDYIIKDIDISGAEIEGLKIQNSRIENCNFTGANLPSLTIDHSELKNANFYGATIGTKDKNANIVRSTVKKLNAKASNLSHLKIDEHSSISDIAIDRATNLQNLQIPNDPDVEMHYPDQKEASLIKYSLARERSEKYNAINQNLLANGVRYGLRYLGREDLLPDTQPESEQDKKKKIPKTRWGKFKAFCKKHTEKIVGAGIGTIIGYSIAAPVIAAAIVGTGGAALVGVGIVAGCAIGCAYGASKFVKTKAYEKIKNIFKGAIKVENFSRRPQQNITKAVVGLVTKSKEEHIAADETISIRYEAKTDVSNRIAAALEKDREAAKLAQSPKSKTKKSKPKTKKEEKKTSILTKDFLEQHNSGSAKGQSWTERIKENSEKSVVSKEIEDDASSVSSYSAAPEIPKDDAQSISDTESIDSFRSASSKQIDEDARSVASSSSSNSEEFFDAKSDDGASKKSNSSGKSSTKSFVSKLSSSDGKGGKPQRSKSSEA